MRLWTLLSVSFLACGLSFLAETRTAKAQNAGQEGESEEFTTADGVLLRGRFHACQNGNPGNEPTVIMMYAPGIDKDMTKNNWAELATTLTKGHPAQDGRPAQPGYNVFRFDWRGHGNSKTISDPNKFWNVPLQGQPYTNQYTGRIHQNRNYMTGFNMYKLKQDISVRDFRNGYWPVLVEDLAAARVHLDLKNDAKGCNTSRVYLIAEGEAASLAMVWMCAEWMRHDTDVLKGAVGVTYNVVPLSSGILNLKPFQERAGSTIRGAIWLTPKLANGITTQHMQSLFDPAKQPALRLTPMLFMYGGLDTTGKNIAVNTFFKQIINAQPHASSSLAPVKGTVVSEIKGVKLVGGALLGNTKGAAEDSIMKYMKEILPNTKAEVKQRDFSFPYFIDLSYFGFNFQ